jgi:drug/metabolite transporter (DMT)-like permease
MYEYIFGASLFKSIIPYMRKHVLNTLNSHDMLYLNALTFFLIVCFIFIYNVVFNKPIIISTFDNYSKLSITQILCLIVISLMAVTVAYFIYELDKFYNTPFINYITLFSITIVASIMISMLIFKEKYNIRHFFGVILTFIGIYLMTSNKME